MAFVWRTGRNLDGIESKQVAIVRDVTRGKRTYGGVLEYNAQGIPCVHGYVVTGNKSGEKGFYTLQEGDVLTLLK